MPARSVVIGKNPLHSSALRSQEIHRGATIMHRVPDDLFVYRVMCEPYVGKDPWHGHRVTQTKFFYPRGRRTVLVDLLDESGFIEPTPLFDIGVTANEGEWDPEAGFCIKPNKQHLVSLFSDSNPFRRQELHSFAEAATLLLV